MRSENLKDILLSAERLTYQRSPYSFAILGDSINVLKQLKSDSVNLIFADAPCKLSKNFNAMQEKQRSVQDHIAWCKIWLEECMRILKDDGTLWLMTAAPYMPYLDSYISKKYHVVSRIVWAYGASRSRKKRKFNSSYKPILMVTKSKDAPYVFHQEDAQRVSGDVWQFPRIRSKMSEYQNHPDQKPEALLERIIRVSSNEGDVILDPFAGSFTASAVAVRLNRKAIGIEINERYFEIGLRRIEFFEMAY